MGWNEWIVERNRERKKKKEKRKRGHNGASHHRTSPHSENKRGREENVAHLDGCFGERKGGSAPSRAVLLLLLSLLWGAQITTHKQTNPLDTHWTHTGHQGHSEGMDEHLSLAMALASWWLTCVRESSLLNPCCRHGVSSPPHLLAPSFPRSHPKKPRFGFCCELTFFFVFFEATDAAKGTRLA